MSQKWKLTPDQIQSILVMYQQGQGPSQLAREFHVDHSSIYYHIRRHGVVRGSQTIVIIRSRKNKKPQNFMPTVFKPKTRADIVREMSFEVINDGKDYKGYLVEELQRKDKILKKLSESTPKLSTITAEKQLERCYNNEDEV